MAMVGAPAVALLKARANGQDIAMVVAESTDVIPRTPAGPAPHGRRGFARSHRYLQSLGHAAHAVPNAQASVEGWVTKPTPQSTEEDVRRLRSQSRSNSISSVGSKDTILGSRVLED